MTDAVRVICTIGDTMRQQGIGVAELQRRLAGRGIRVSRGALDRLVSDQPLKSVNFDLLVPILEELGLKLGEPFVALAADEFEQATQVKRRAREAARALANGSSSVHVADEDEADQADRRTVELLEQRLRREHPEAFDQRGRLRKRALTRALVTHFGGRHLTREQVDDVIAAGRDAAARRRAAR